MTAHPRIVVGVDTHTDTHTAVAVDHLGRHLGELIIATTEPGYRELVDWAQDLGPLTAMGIEGTGCYGAGLVRYLTTNTEIAAIEVNRPNRQHRRRHGKSDPADAKAAAIAVLNGTATGPAKQRRSNIEAIRQLHMVRRSAIKSRTMCANQIKDLAVTAPEAIATQLRARNTNQRVRIAATWDPNTVVDDPAAAAAIYAIRSLTERYQALTAEIKDLEAQLWPLLQATAPTLLAEHGVGLDVAAKLLIAVGENPDRLASEASFAALCGTSPVDASSGKHTRHRLNRGGNRHANNALHTVWLTRARSCDETRTYIAKREQHGRTRREISRCIKRALARRFHHIILKDLTNHLT